MNDMIDRALVIFAVALFCVGCTTTEFQSWEGRNNIVKGHGGTRKIIDGIDVWTYGDPPRHFQILGIIQDERPSGLIPIARLKHDIARKARQRDGDAVILVSSESQLRGYYTSGVINTQIYGRSATSLGSATTVPISRRTSTYVVIHYVD